MKNNHIKWTHDMRVLLYTKVIETFGKFDTWGAIANPKGKNKEFISFCDELAIALSIIANKPITGLAVKQQINWAKNPTLQIKSRGHNYNYIVNKAAALETGFIHTGNLSEIALFGDYKKIDYGRN